MGKLSGVKQSSLEAELVEDIDLELGASGSDELDDDELDLTTGDGEWLD